MCKNLLNRVKAIESIRATTPYVVEVYDTYDGNLDLVSLIAIDDKSVARVYDVHRDGSTEFFRTVAWNDPSKRTICALTDSDPRFCKIVA